MRDKPSSEYARATATCVNMAIDAIETTLSRELAVAPAETAVVLRKILVRVRAQRIETTAGTGDSLLN